jgi:hypothetical protein
MGILLRKLKAALGIGTIWGIAAGAVGTTLGGLSGIPTGWFLSSALVFGVGSGVAGLILGAGFGGLLSVMEGRRTLDELTPHRAALWGFVAGAALTLVGTITVASLKMGVVEMAVSGLGLPIGVQLTAIAAGAVSYGAVTAGLAAATVSLAKRNPSGLQSGSSASAPDLLVSGEP